MLRRSIAGVILGVSLLLASLAWSGFVALRTVLDPGQSQRMADNLYDDPDVRDALTDNIASAVLGLLPAEIEVPREQVDAVATAVLDDPRVEILVTQALVQTHAAFLGEGDMPAQLDAGVVGQAAREQLVAAEPQLDPVLPAAPALVVPLPTEHIPNLGPVRRALQAAVPVLAVAAVGGIVMAFVTTSNRPSVLRRAGIWAIGAAAFIVIVGLGLPWLIRRMAPDQGEVAAALFATLVESVLVPSLVLAGAGAAAIVVGMAWPQGGRTEWVRRDEPVRRPRPPADRRGPATGGAVHRPPVAPPGWDAPPAGYDPSPARRPRPPLASQGPPTREQPAVRDPRPPQLREPLAPPPPTTPAPTPPPPAPRAAAPIQPTPPASESQRRWVEGRGWVDEPPPAPRWVPGVGYVEDNPIREDDS